MRISVRPIFGVAPFISCVILSSALYLATRPNYDRIDNDLKYRYIKMKGEALPERIAELEELFELNRDNTKIHQMKKMSKNTNEPFAKNHTRRTSKKKIWRVPKFNR